MEKQKLLFHQARLSNRGVAEMVLLHISASKGIPSEMVMTTLNLGIAILRGGNIDIQMGMLNHLKEKKDVGFFTSIAGLMNSCSVLDLDAFERNTKAEGNITPQIIPIFASQAPSLSLLLFLPYFPPTFCFYTETFRINFIKKKQYLARLSIYFPIVVCFVP